MFYEPTYRAMYPLINQLTSPSGWWVHAHISAVRRFSAYREG